MELFLRALEKEVYSFLPDLQLYYFSIEVWIYLFFDDEKLCCLLWATDCLYPLFKRIVVLNVVKEVYFVEVQTMRTIAYNSKN